MVRIDIYGAQELLTGICWNALRMLGAYLSARLIEDIQPVGSFHCLRVLEDLRRRTGYRRNNDHTLGCHRFRTSTLLSHCYLTMSDVRSHEPQTLR